MSQTTAECVICGAGIAGVAAAYHLAVKRGMDDVVLVEQGAPLSLTSDKSTECYRNWWPGPGDAMVRFMSRSVDLLEEIARETDNAIRMNRRGYLFATADPDRIQPMLRAAEESAALGAGTLRVHGRLTADDTESAERRITHPSAPSAFSAVSSYSPAPPHGFEDQPDGADLLLDPALIREHFPYLSERTVAALHVRRAGWFSAQQLGMHLLERARERGVRLLRGEVTGVELGGGRVRAVRVAGETGTTTIATPRFVNAAGPMQKAVGRMLGVELPVYAERHVKIAFSDTLGAMPREAPLLIWSDPVRLPWSDEERAELAGSEETRWLLETFPAGVHGRPEGHAGGSVALLLWTYDADPVEPRFPLTFEPHYPEIVLRGMAVMLPALSAYFDRPPRPYVDGGYYTRTRENRPLVGPLPVEGAYLIGGLGGFGLMAASAAGELLAAHVAGAALPEYAPAFALSRYDDPDYRALVERWGESGQL